MMPPGPDLVRHNRRVLAARLGWPVGALQECERIGRLYADWAPWWRWENPRTGDPEGFYAMRDWDRVWVYGETSPDLVAAIALAPERPW